MFTPDGSDHQVYLQVNFFFASNVRSKVVWENWYGREKLKLFAYSNENILFLNATYIILHHV